MHIYNYNPGYAGMRFEWDPEKNLANERKHGLSFEEGAELFRDPLFASFKERIEHGEQRWQSFGMVEGAVLLMAAHTIREVDQSGSVIEVIRIISVRYATRKERERYENENG